MSPDSEQRAAVELEAEQEVDFGRYAQTIAARWWLLVVGAVLGAFIGFLITLSDGKIYKATAQVYLGQPLAPDSAAAVTTSPTTLGLVQAFVTSEDAIEKAASAVGLRPSRLRDHVTARPIPGTSTTRQAFPAPLLSIQVTGSSRVRTAAAANHLAQQAVEEVGAYTTTKITTLDQQLKYIGTQLGLVNARLTAARASQSEIVSNPSLSPVEKLVALTNLNSEITLAEQRQVTLELNRYNTTRALSLAKDIEASRVTAAAVAVRTEPTSRRTSVLVGAFIGLLLGIVAALLWDPVSGRLAARTA
ncbi:MAG: Wzz/FepE/Etk N-terminal domain-containing protein [Gaiellales bacterium]